jgi:hypothetical protein
MRGHGSFLFIGNGREANGSFHNIHTPAYDFKDSILALGAAYWVRLVQAELEAEQFPHAGFDGFREGARPSHHITANGGSNSVEFES